MTAGPAPRPKVPRPEVPTTEQLGLAPRTLLWRGLFGRCPVCGDRHIFQRWFTMKERCPTCEFRFERVDGHWIGAIGVNTVCVMGLMLIVLAAVTFSQFPDSPPVGPLIAVEVVIALIGPLVFFPASRTLWSAMDLLMRPLLPGEVDPRVVVVDPFRDGTRPAPKRPSGDPRRRTRDPRGGLK